MDNRAMILCLFALFLVSCQRFGLDRQKLNSDLFEAAEKGDLRSVTSLVRSGADVNARRADGTTVLLQALKGRHDKVAEFLLSSGADPNGVGSDGAAPLLEASQRAPESVLKVLISKGADTHRKDKGGKTPLMLAAEHGNVAAIRTLLRTGSDVNGRDMDGNTPLMIAAKQDQTTAVQVLAAEAADVMARDPGEIQNTALTIAAMWAGPYTIQALLDAGADPNYQRTDGATALMFSSIRGDSAAVCALLDAGADSTIKEKNGETAMGFAEKHPEIVALLKQARARRYHSPTVDWNGKQLTYTRFGALATQDIVKIALDGAEAWTSRDRAVPDSAAWRALLALKAVLTRPDGEPVLQNLWSGGTDTEKRLAGILLYAKWRIESNQMSAKAERAESEQARQLAKLYEGVPPTFYIVNQTDAGIANSLFLYRFLKLEIIGRDRFRKIWEMSTGDARKLHFIE